jgi:small subunit ribosomal protein S8
MLTDTISDMLTTIRNGQARSLATVSVPASTLRANILTVLQSEGYIRGFNKENVRKGIDRISIELKYSEGQPVIKEIWRESKPGLRKYTGAGSITKVKNGLGTAILSTSKGIMTDAQARRDNIGGEILFGIF